jgi:S-formylglutathione hydrolase FrmB
LRTGADVFDANDVVTASIMVLGSAVDSDGDSRQGIRCAVVARAGKHDWPFAASAFATALPWMAGQLRTPGVPPGLISGPMTPPQDGSGI